MYTLLPLCRYSLQVSARRSHATTRNHSVSSITCPSEPLRDRLTATEKVVIGVPCGVYFISGSLPRLPISRTLLSPRDICGLPYVQTLNSNLSLLKSIQNFEFMSLELF